MANQPVLKGIKNSWSLIAFAKSHGRMQVAPFSTEQVDETTGDVTKREFKSCVFTNPEDNTRVFVSFSSKLGELTPQEIVDRKNDLQVVQLESGNYSLCRVGDNSWEDVNLF